MNFTSFHFVGFFFVTLILGRILKNRTQRVFLLLASYYFYGVFEPWYLFLILSSSLLDYVAGIGIEARRLFRSGVAPEALTTLERYLIAIPRRAWLAISILVNLGLLGYFKYTNFGIEVVNDLHPLGDTFLAWPATHILLPVGISFYTFQSMSYTIDVYRQTLAPRRDIVDFFLYVAFFPQLVAGPIVRASTFFQSLDNRLSVRTNDIIIGLTRIVVGLFRKMVLADNIGLCVDPIYGDFMNGVSAGYIPYIHPVDVMLAAFGFAFQIYFDFAGYTDIARGVARLFGFEFEINFLYPMAATNIKDHWSRWHISLTTWIRDYIFFPLGGSRVSPWRADLNILIIWFLTGIWHGASYHFVAWGVWQGVMMIIHRYYSRTKLWDKLNSLTGLRGFLYKSVTSRLILFWSLYFGFIWFRAPTMDVATQMIGRSYFMYDLLGAWDAFVAWLTGSGQWNLVTNHIFCTDIPGRGVPWVAPAFASFWFLILICWVYEFAMNRLQLEYFWKEENRAKLIFMLVAMIFCIVVFGAPQGGSFLYFQF